jgi:hypothetical protein
MSEAQPQGADLAAVYGSQLDDVLDAYKKAAMAGCLMPRCPREVFDRGMCMYHHSRAYPDDLSGIRAHIARENAVHPAVAAGAKKRHEAKKAGKKVDWAVEFADLGEAMAKAAGAFDDLARRMREFEDDQ